MNLHNINTVRESITLCPRIDGMGSTGPNPVRRYMTRPTDKQAILLLTLAEPFKAGISQPRAIRASRIYNLVETYPVLYPL